MLNVNAPNCPPHEVRGIRRTSWRRSVPCRRWSPRHGAGYVKLAYEGVDADLEPGTDAAALADGAASVTALHAVCEEAEAELPDALDLGVG